MNPLLLVLALLGDVEARIDELMKSHRERLKAAVVEEIRHAVAHEARRAKAEEEGRLEAAERAAKRAKPERIAREDGSDADAETVWKDLRKKKIVYVAESHDHPRHHELELETIRQMDGGKGDLSVGFEMFPRSLQPVLDKWNAGELTEWQFLEEVGWYRVWGFPYTLFRPIFQYCRENGIPLVGLNAPADVNRKVGRQGLASLTSEERARLPRQIRLDDRAHRARFREMMPYHPSINFNHYYEAFCVWDDTMAESVAQWIGRSGGRMVVIAGSGHIRGRLGIPERAKARLETTYGVLVPWDVQDREANLDFMLAPGGDFVWWTKEAHEPPRPKLGVGIDAELKVTAVAAGSAAEKAGLKVGDVLVKAGGRKMTTPESIRHFMEIRSGEEFSIVVKRAGEERKLRASVPLK